MGTGYTRNDTANNIADGNVINAAPLDGEFDALVSAFAATTGHNHDGASANGGPVSKLGPSGQLEQTSAALVPSSDNAIDLGTSSAEFKDLYLDGIAYIDKLTVAASNGGTDGVGSHLEPTATATYNLGSSTYAFNTGFLTALNVRKNDAPVVTLTNLSTDMTATEIVGSIIWESLDTQQSGVDLAQIDAVVVDSLDDAGGDQVKLTFKTGNAEALTLAMTLQGDDIIAPDDIGLQSDASVLSFGADSEVSLTHVHNTGLLLNSTMAIQFRDSGLAIASSTDGQLDIDADTEIEIVAPTVDIDASTTMTVNTTTLAITGATDITGDLDVDNININGNTITSTNTNGDIAITPNGNGKIVLDGLNFPIADGNSNEVLKTDGSGQLSFTAIDTDLSADSSPQLAGNLDLNSNDITGTGNINTTGTATLTTADNLAQLTLISTDTDANFGPNLILKRNGDNGADLDDLGIIQFQGKDDGGNNNTFAYILAEIIDASASAKGSRLRFFTFRGNTSTEQLTLGHNTVIVNNAGADVDFKVKSSTNPNALFVLGSSNKVGLGTSVPDTQLDIESSSGPQITLNDTGGALGGDMNTNILCEANGSEHGRIGFATSGGNMQFTNQNGDVFIQADLNNAKADSKIQFNIDNSTASILTAGGYTTTSNFKETTLSDASTISWNASVNQVTKVTIAANRTLGQATNQVAGAVYVLTIIQDGSGGHTLSYHTTYKFSGTVPVVTSTANARTILVFLSDGTNMYEIGRSLNPSVTS